MPLDPGGGPSDRHIPQAAFLCTGEPIGSASADRQDPGRLDDDVVQCPHWHFPSLYFILFFEIDNMSGGEPSSGMTVQKCMKCVQFSWTLDPSLAAATDAHT